MNILNKYIPPANSPGNIWQGTIPSPYNTDEVLAKIDHSFSDRNLLTGSYYETSGANSQSGGGNIPWSTQNFIWRQQNVNASDTATISPNLVNQFWVTYSRNFGGRLSTPQLSLGDLGSLYHIQGTPSLPQITVTGYFTLAQAISGPVAGTNFYSTRDVLSYAHGRHTLKFGGELALDKDIQQTLLNNYGVFSFSGAKSGNALGDYLLGAPVTMNQDAPITAMDDFWTGALFAQDDIRIRPRLTLNLGLRWELQQAPTDPHNREGTFEAGVQSPTLKGANVPNGLLVVGDPGLTRGIVATPLKHFSPRLGMAWDPFGDGKTSIRAGAGLFWGSVSGNEWNSTSNFQPFAVREQFNTVQSLTNPYGLLPGGVSPFPFSYNPSSPQFIFPAEIYGMALNFKWPYTYQLNFSVQRQLAKGFTVTAAYVGSLAHRLPFADDLNYPYYNSTATTSNVNNRRPIEPGTLAQIFLVESIMNTSYNGLQFTAEKRMGRHVSAKGFYTFSKSIDDAELENNTTNGGAQDYRNLSEERARSDFDRRNVMVAEVIWDMSYFGQSNKSNPFLRAVIDGWSLSAIATLESGTPFSVTTGKDNNLDGNTTDRANLVGAAALDPHRGQALVSQEWFNTAAFASGANGTDGTSGRNTLDAPGTKNVDLALFRNFKFHERFTFQARGEFTNAFNIVNLGGPTTTLSSSLFGQIRSASAMRQTQLGLRLTF